MYRRHRDNLYDAALSACGRLGKMNNYLTGGLVAARPNFNEVLFPLIAGAILSVRWRGHS
jgi:hypothetical protein